MKKTYNLSLRVITIMIIFVIFLFNACKNTYEDDSIEKNDISPMKGLEHFKEESSDLTDNVEEASKSSVEEGDLLANDDEYDDQNAYHYFVMGDGVHIREEASIDSNILLQLNNGTKVAMIANESDWVKVKIDNIQGYIRSDFLSIQDPDEKTTKETTKEITDEIMEESTEETLDETGTATGDTMNLVTNPKIIVKKNDRILELWDGNSLYGSYPIGLGWDPIGDKNKEGDGRTPEGSYYVCTRNNYSRFYLSLGVSYPNSEDAREALETALIDQSTYQQIADAINEETQPPWNTAMGGEIMIHGHGAQSDWTAGCIAVENNIMDILWDKCPLGTPIIIEP